MPSQTEQRYGVPLPIDVLWSLLSDQLGPERTNGLRAIYRAAAKRYSRAAELNRRRRLVAHYERAGRTRPRLAVYRASLADPMAYIDGGDGAQAT